MAISFRKYIDITSGVGAGAAVARREFIGRLFTDNLLLPPDSFIEFDSLKEVGDYFGTTSEEYKRASFYFGWISKNITRAKKISFARWVDVDVAPRIYGARLVTTLTQFHAITAGAFSLTLGVNTHVISGLDFSGAASLAAIAVIIEDAIQAQTGTMWTAATVTYDATRGGFNLVGGSAIAAAVSVAVPGSGTDISLLMGWRPEAVDGVNGAIWADGKLTETITNVLTNSDSASDNFGSFLFLPTLNLSQLIETAEWNTAQNVKYMFVSRVLAADAVEYSGALLGYAGVALTLAPLSAEYPEQMPMMIFAATDYSARNSTVNYMFQQFNITPSVTDTTLSNVYDDLRINYYGRTQQAGRLLDFYQRGTLTGLAVNPTDMNTYANEAWLKDAIGASIMQLLLALSKISANIRGRSQILNIIQSTLDEALKNGVISAGKTLITIQQVVITEITGNDKAWYQVQTSGYWVNCEIVRIVTDSNTVEYHANYILVYSKDDVIRKVNGTHVLI